MSIDQTFANSADDPAVTNLIQDYITSRDQLPVCNCGTATRKCTGNSITSACRQTISPDGGVYTKLDQGGFLNFDYQTKLNELNTVFDNILNEISIKKNFIANPPNPQDPNLPALIEENEDDIARMGLTLEELSIYVTQIRIQLA
jgi:hypothetical protein